MKRTIGVWGISSHEEHLIKCLLQLLESRTSDEWSLSSASEAEVVIINADSDPAMRPETNGRMVVEYTADIGRDSELALHRPIRSTELLRLLNRLSDSLETADDPAPLAGQARNLGAAISTVRPDTRSIIGRIRQKLGING